MRGRKPKPTHLKAITGNPGKRPLNHHEPRPDPMTPECPIPLPDHAKAEWTRLCAELGKLRILTSLDQTALANYCVAYGIWRDAIAGLAEFGTVVKSPQGFPIQSPWLSIANRQTEIMLRISSEFGFTPASWSRIRTPGKDEPDLFGAVG